MNHARNAKYNLIQQSYFCLDRDKTHRGKLFCLKKTFFCRSLQKWHWIMFLSGDFHLFPSCSSPVGYVRRHRSKQHWFILYPYCCQCALESTNSMTFAVPCCVVWCCIIISDYSLFSSIVTYLSLLDGISSVLNPWQRIKHLCQLYVSMWFEACS